MPTPSGTLIQQAIIDAAGVEWTINDAGEVAVNGVGDATTSNVIAIGYTGGQVWQQNSKLRWWYKTTNPTGASWLPQGGTLTSPFPSPPAAPTAVIAS